MAQGRLELLGGWARVDRAARGNVARTAGIVAVLGL